MPRMRTTASGRVTFLLVCSCIYALMLQSVNLIQARSSIPIPSFTVIESPVLSFELRTPYVSSSQLNGTTVNFHPGFAGAALPLSTRADGLLDINIMLPHRSDDITGCSGAWNTTNEFGQSFQNSFILQMVGSCASINTFHVAANTGAAGVIVFGCPTEKPYNCDGRITFAFSLIPSGSAVPPILSIDSADGSSMVQFLRGALNSTTAPPTDSLRLVAKGPGSIVPEERAALIAIMQQSTFGPFIGGSQLDLLPDWSLARFRDLTIDPCFNRTIGIWCELGHVVSIDVFYHVWMVNSGMPIEFGAFSQLRLFSNVVNGFIGPVPESWCNLTSLTFFRFSQQLEGGATSFPDCIGTAWNRLVNFQFDGNSLTALPDSFSQLINLEIIRASGNAIQVVPSLVNLTRLTIIDFSSNAILAVPTFSPVAVNLMQIGFPSNQITAPINPNAFDGMTSLQIIDLNTNHITGPLPNFIGCTSLQIIDFSSQRNLTTNQGGFNDSMPSSWQYLTSLEELYLQENALLSPVYASSMLSLERIDMSHNYLTNALATDPNNADPSAFLTTLLSPSLISMKVSYNLIAGPLSDTSNLLISNTLSELYLDHNQFTSMFSLFISASPFSAIDLSYNNISANTLPAGAPALRFLYLNLRGNPYLQLDILPSWMVVGSTFTEQSDSLYGCSSFSATTAPFLALNVDPTFWSYQNCECRQGTFGRAPLCHSIPNAAALNPRHVITSAEIGDEFSALVASVRAVGSDLTVPNTSNYSRSFSDSMYGENRATLGMSTVWEIDVTTEYEDDPELYVNAGYQAPAPLRTFSINTTADTPSPLWTPVRMITVRLHVSATEFSDFNDVISIYEGSSDLKGNRVFTMRGTDTKSTVVTTVYTNSPEYLLANNASISQISDPRLYEIQVFSSMASVQFTSRATTGLHFYATYSYDFTCPDGYFYNRDTTPNQCRLNYEMYHVGLSIRSAVFVVSSLTIIFIMINIVILALHWSSPIYKAASRIFMAVILVFLLFMGLGSLLYASIPNVNDVGSAICIGRGWLTCLPLTGILGVLLAKTNRLNAIFGATTLQVKKLTDLDIAKTVLLVCSLQIILLAVFSGLPLSRAQLSLGHGSVADRLVYSCSQESGFMIWMGIEIAYIACLMLPAAYLGYKTRNLPSQYNESSHIQNAIVLLIFFGIIIVPLDIFIQDSPDAAVLIQGLGQGFLCAMMTLIIFGPKLYFLVQYDHSKNVNQGTRLSQEGETDDTTGKYSNKDHVAHTSSIHTQAVPMTSTGSGGTPNHRVSGIGGHSTGQSLTPKYLTTQHLQPPQAQHPRTTKPLPLAVIPTTGHHRPSTLVNFTPAVTSSRRPSIHQPHPATGPASIMELASISTPTQQQSPALSQCGAERMAATPTPSPHPTHTAAATVAADVNPSNHPQVLAPSSTSPSPSSSASPPIAPSPFAVLPQPSPPRRVIKIHHTFG